MTRPRRFPILQSQRSGPSGITPSFYSLHSELSHHARASIPRPDFASGRSLLAQRLAQIKLLELSCQLAAAVSYLFVITWVTDLLQRIAATVLDFRERFAGYSERRSFTGEGLPAANCDVDVERIELNRPCLASALVRGDNGRARS